MIALPQHRMTADEFLVWAGALPREAGGFELMDGKVIVTREPAGQQSERSQHWEAKSVIYRALHDAIKRAELPCYATPDGASVKMANDRVVGPDALVYCGERVPPDNLYVPNPVIVIEVLSPSTAKYVATDKLFAYFNHPSIQHCLIVDPDKPLVIHHQRGTADRWMTRIVPSGELRLDPPGLDVDLTELFERN